MYVNLIWTKRVRLILAQSLFEDNLSHINQKNQVAALYSGFKKTRIQLLIQESCSSTHGSRVQIEPAQSGQCDLVLLT